MNHIYSISMLLRTIMQKSNYHVAKIERWWLVPGLEITDPPIIDDKIEWILVRKVSTVTLSLSSIISFRSTKVTLDIRSRRWLSSSSESTKVTRVGRLCLCCWLSSHNSGRWRSHRSLRTPPIRIFSAPSCSYFGAGDLDDKGKINARIPLVLFLLLFFPSSDVLFFFLPFKESEWNRTINISTGIKKFRCILSTTLHHQDGKSIEFFSMIFALILRSNDVVVSILLFGCLLQQLLRNGLCRLVVSQTNSIAVVRINIRFGFHRRWWWRKCNIYT